MYFTRDKYSKLFFRINIILLLFFAVYFRWVNHGWKKIVESDGRGYYAYLPSIISYNDLSFKHYQDTTLFKSGYHDNFLYLIDGKYVIKYTAGVAVMLSPFYLVADIISRVSGFRTDGYSFFYMIFVSLAAIFYALAGIYFCLQLLAAFGVSRNVSYAIGAILLFGTNLLVYTIHEPSMSHVYSFMATAGFLYHIKCYFDFNRTKNLLLASIALGLIILIRPINAIILFSVFFLFPDLGEVKKFFLLLFTRLHYTLLAAFISFLIIGIQPVIWYFENGHFIVWTYLGETFNWLHPEFLNVLLSYRKGWIVYTPFALLLPLTAIYLMFARNLIRLIFYLFFWILVIYVISSWWCWYYGGSFGQRAFIEFYPVLVLSVVPLLIWIDIRRNSTRIFYCFSGVCIFLNLIQSYQYRNHILHYDSMTKSKYWQIFLKTGAEYEWLVYINPNSIPPDEFTDRVIASSFNDFESNASPVTWQPIHHDILNQALSGNHVAIFGLSQAYGPMYKEALGTESSYAGFYFRGFVYIDADFGYNKSELAIALDDSSGKTYYTASIPLGNNLIPSEADNWLQLEYRVDLPEVKPGSKLVIYIYSPECKMALDDISFFIYKK